ncbi:hypothetical protein LA080_009050 [Diaporthe eres]|nr:hypothetical protein LA080_009050 [Diaporthe eres]
MATDGANDPGESRRRIILDNVIYEPVSSVVASRQQRSQVSMWNDRDLKGMEPYKYRGLRSMRRRLRLLRLHGGGLLNPEITCELFEVEYDKDDQNIVRRVLSKDERSAKRERVYEGGKYYRLPVTRDLTLALKYLRHPHAERILWIDALCINQANHEERNHQVQMMARIYSGAKQACIWLGEDTDDSTTAIRFINEIMKLENFDAISEKKENSFKWQSLLLLMQRPWFSRRWVVQEIALARSATIYCGNDKIPWTNFAVAVELFVEVETATHRLSEVMRKDETFGHVPQWFEHVSELGASVLVQATGKVFRRDGNQATDSEDGVDAKPRLRARRPARKGLKRNETGEVEGPSQRSALAPQRPLLSLEYLVSSLSVFQATQPRDAVYSLLAISRDTAPFAELRIKSQEGSEEAIIMSTVSSFLERKPFRVDYSRAYSDVCKDFISFCIQISGRSDPTRALDILCRPWAPEPEVTTGGVVHRKPTLYKFLPSRERETLFKVDKSRQWIIRVKGEDRSDEDMEKPKALIEQDDERTTERYWQDCEQDWKDNWPERVSSFERDVKPFLPKKRLPPKKAEDEGEQEDPASSEQEDSDAEGEGIDDEEQNEQDKDISLPTWISRISGASFALYRHPGMHKAGRIGRMNADPLAVIWNRCLIKTDEPLSVLGLASQHVQKDDLICIIFGCTVPVILRIKYKAEGAPGKEKMQDQIESMKAAMEVCEEACFRKIRYQKRLQIEKAKGGGLDTIWKKEVLAELEEVNSQMRKWKEREEEDKERKIAEDKDQENRKERIKRRQREARMTRDEAKLQPLQKSKTMPDAGLRSMVTKTGPSPVKEGMPEQSEGAQSTHATPPQTHGQDGHDGVRETGQTTTEQLEKERQKKKDEAREEDPKVYYEFLGEAYIHGMMDGEAVRRQINEGEPTRMFEIR